MQPEADAGDADAQRPPGETQRPSGGPAVLLRVDSSARTKKKAKAKKVREGWDGLDEEQGTTWAALAKSMTVLEGFG